MQQMPVPPPPHPGSNGHQAGGPYGNGPVVVSDDEFPPLGGEAVGNTTKVENQPQTAENHKPPKHSSAVSNRVSNSFLVPTVVKKK